MPLPHCYVGVHRARPTIARATPRYADHRDRVVWVSRLRASPRYAHHRWHRRAESAPGRPRSRPRPRRASPTPLWCRPLAVRRGVSPASAIGSARRGQPAVRRAAGHAGAAPGHARGPHAAPFHRIPGADGGRRTRATRRRRASVAPHQCFWLAQCREAGRTPRWRPATARAAGGAPEKPPRSAGRCHNGFTVDLNAPFGRTVEPGDEPQQRRLAAARRPELRDDLTRLDFDVDFVQHRMRSERAVDTAKRYPGQRRISRHHPRSLGIVVKHRQVCFGRDSNPAGPGRLRR